MKIDFSNKKVLMMIGGAVFVLILLIGVVIFFMRRKSNYVLADTSSDGSFNYDATICQAQYDTNISAGQSVATATATKTTCLTNAMTNFIQRKCPYVIGNAPSVANGDSQAQVTNWTNYQTDLTTIQNAYQAVLQTAVGSGAVAAGASVTAADALLMKYTAGVAPAAGTPPEINISIPSSGISSALVTALGATPILVGQGVPASIVTGASNPGTVIYVSGTTLPITFSVQFPVGTTFTGGAPGGATVIQKGLATAFSFAGASAPAAGTLTQDIVRAARKSDITGATRKYLAISCPSFYTNATSGYMDPTCAYLNWNPAVSSAVNYGFKASKVADSAAGRTNIMNWARYASIFDSNGNVTGPLLSAGSAHTIASGGRTYGQIARDFGPGTIANPGMSISAGSFTQTMYPTSTVTKTCTAGNGGLTAIPADIYSPAIGASGGWKNSSGTVAGV